jgi:hypothetical protein
MITLRRNKPDAVNPAMALRFAVEHQWRRVTDLERSAVNVIRHIAVTFATVLMVSGCDQSPGDRAPAVVSIGDPCNTFVSEFAPNRTPALKRTDDGQYTLEISFTPAKNREADSIVSVLKQHPVKLRITKTGREIQALRLARIFHKEVERRSGGGIIKVDITRPNESAHHHFFKDRL